MTIIEGLMAAVGWLGVFAGGLMLIVGLYAVWKMNGPEVKRLAAERRQRAEERKRAELSALVQREVRRSIARRHARDVGARDL